MKKKRKKLAGTEINIKSKETRHQRNIITTVNNKKQRVNYENRLYFRDKSKYLTRNTSSASNETSKSKNIFIFSDSILKTLKMKKFNSMLNDGEAHIKSSPGSKAKQ